MVRSISPRRSNALIEAVRSCAPHFIAVAVFSALLNVLYLAPTLYMMQVYDRAIPTGGDVTLAAMTAVLVFALVSLSTIEWVRSRLLVRVGVKLDQDLSGPILSAVISQPDVTRQDRASAMREFDHLRQAIAGAGTLALFDAPWAVIFLTVATLVHPLLGLMGVCSAAVLLLLAFLNERQTRRPLQAANDAASVVYAAESYASTSAPAVRALGMTQAIVAKQIFDREAMNALQVRASLSAGVYGSLIKGFRLILQSVALGLGAYLAIRQEISAGAVFAASLLLARTLSPIEQTVGAWKSLVLSYGAFNKLSKLLSDTPDREVHTALPTPAGAILLEGVRLDRAGGEPPVLKGLSFSIAPGEFLGVIGPSGAGKSSLIRLLARAEQPSGGVLRLDGAAFADWEPETFSHHVGYVPQDFVLFAGSVSENISRFRRFVDGPSGDLDAAVITAAKAAGAHDMILRLPQGYDTAIGFGGRGLSAGQAQRIAIARGLFNDPKILIMDEPNANLDGEGEMSLIETLKQRKAAGTTIVVVAHRNSILAEADNLLLLQDGQIKAHGHLNTLAQHMRQNRTGDQPRSTDVGATVKTTVRRA